jgi:hypothetical protein
MSVPRSVARLAQDAFLLARYAAPHDGPPDGRAWERAASGLLIRPEFPRRQHAGTLGLFGCGSMSGTQHEFDGAGHGAEIGVWLECKARQALDKGEVSAFAFKCLDLYREAAREEPDATASRSWWPILVSSESVDMSVRRSCLGMGVILCEPEFMPLPMLLHIAAKPVADEWIDESALAEFVRLAEPLIRPLQKRYRVDIEAKELRWSLREPGAAEIGDLVYRQQELTADLFDLFDHESPGHFEHLGVQLADRMHAASLTV